jgi:hypothetical protein
MRKRETVGVDMGNYITYVDKKKAVHVEDMYEMLHECSILLRNGTEEHANKCADKVDFLLNKIKGFRNEQ